MLHCKTSNGSRERWFDVDSVASTLAGEGTAPAGVRASSVVKVGYVQYYDDGHDVGVPSTSRFLWCPGRRKKKRSSASPILKKKISVSSRTSTHTFFEAALEISFAEPGARRSGPHRRNGPVFQGDTNNHLTAYMFEYFSHL